MTTDERALVGAALLTLSQCAAGPVEPPRRTRTSTHA